MREPGGLRCCAVTRGIVSEAAKVPGEEEQLEAVVGREAWEGRRNDIGEIGVAPSKEALEPGC